MIAAVVFGGGSLALFAVFLFRGPLRLFTLDGPVNAALGIDIALCLLFFTQHSVMVRRSFQDRLGSFVPAYLHRAIYAIVSGVLLIALVIIWQPTSILFSAQGAARWLLRAAFLGGLAGFVWGVKALGSFDGFGIQPIKAYLGSRKLRAAKFMVRGPYKYVRHPLYSFALVLLWSFPDVSPDRLLLNITFSIWVFAGTVLEERDLVSEFG